MAIHLTGLRLVTLGLLVNFVFVRNQDAVRKRNFTTPDRRISEIKCLESIGDIVRNGKEHRPLIVCGGCRPALDGEFSHMGAVGWRSLQIGEDMMYSFVYKCGASLISNKFLITAAHCSRLPKHTRSFIPEPVVVKLGVNSIYTDDRLTLLNLRWIKKFINYPYYLSPHHYYDIALIELTRSVDFGPLIRPACLWNSRDTSAFENVQVSGWGEISPWVMSDKLLFGNIGIIDNGYCDTLLKKHHNRNWYGLSEHQLCAGVLSGDTDTCRGDSGGPLQAKRNASLQWPVYYVIGVTSFGHGCMRPNVPGVYVKTASFVDWIESIVWPET